MPAPLKTGEALMAWQRQVSHPTWLTCRKSLLRLAGPSPARQPRGSDYLRRLTSREVEALGDREGHPAAPRLLGRVCRCELRSAYSPGAGHGEAGQRVRTHFSLAASLGAA